MISGRRRIRQIVEVEELRGTAVIEPDFVAATVSNGFVLSEVYVSHAPMMPRAVRRRKSSIPWGAENRRAHGVVEHPYDRNVVAEQTTGMSS
jgi:hypothetical protein